MEKYGKIGKKDLKGYNSRVRHKPVQKGIMVLKLRIWLHFIEGKFTEHFFAFNAHFHEENINPVFLTPCSEEAEILIVQCQINEMKIRVING